MIEKLNLSTEQEKRISGLYLTEESRLRIVNNIVENYNRKNKELEKYRDCSSLKDGWQTSILANYSNGTNFYSSNEGTGTAMRLENTTGATGMPFIYTKQGVTKSSINDAGDVSGQKIIASDVVRLKGYTVATLPTGVQGDTAFVTDAMTPTYLGVLVGGGAIVTPVFYNGTMWVSH